MPIQWGDSVADFPEITRFENGTIGAVRNSQDNDISIQEKVRIFSFVKQIYEIEKGFFGNVQKRRCTEER